MARGRKPGERARALHADEVTYTGAPCRRCKNTERYTSNGGCIECQNNKAAAEVRERESIGRAREIAIHRKMVRYTDDEPCSKCGSFERYTSNRSCIKCIKARVGQARAERAELWHSTTSPVVWINHPPSPETAALYAMCPSLAAWCGEWTAVYSDAHHLSPGARIYPGCDVLKRPAPLQMMLNDKNHPGHAIAIHLAPAYYAALRQFNDKICGR